MLKIMVLLVLSVFSSKLVAFDLFGVNLIETSRNDMRRAVEGAGLVLIRKDDTLDFDEYDSSLAFKGASRLYLGFTEQGARFAFAEYEIVGFRYTRLKQNLQQKYGLPKISTGKYISDKTFYWSQEGIEITLSTDWQNYATRLSYIAPEALAELRKARFVATQESTRPAIEQASSLY